MPCRVDDPYRPPTSGSVSTKQGEAAKSKRSIPSNKKDLDKISELETLVNYLSVTVDSLRDTIYDIRTEIPADFLSDELSDKIDKILDEQTDHRQQDLLRLVTTFGADPTPDNLDRLRKVLAADPHKPLEPQLGFNPDDF